MGPPILLFFIDWVLCFGNWDLGMAELLTLVQLLCKLCVSGKGTLFHAISLLMRLLFKEIVIESLFFRAITFPPWPQIRVTFRRRMPCWMLSLALKFIVLISHLHGLHGRKPLHPINYFVILCFRHSISVALPFYSPL